LTNRLQHPWHIIDIFLENHIAAFSLVQKKPMDKLYSKRFKNDKYTID